MARFASEKYKSLLVSFANGEKVRFEGGVVEVFDETADLMREYARAHADYEISEAESDESDDAEREADEQVAANDQEVPKSDEAAKATSEADEKSEGDERSEAVGKADESGDKYDAMKVGDLRKEARDRGLDDAGSPDAVKDRLRAADKSEAVG